MDRLPEEVILQILHCLDVADVVRLQLVSKRYMIIGRDNSFWKIECFDTSKAESLRRRKHLLSVQDVRLTELRNALAALPGSDLTAWDVAQINGSNQPRSSDNPVTEARTQRVRALANWDPGYVNERLDYYEEYIGRHGRINVGWLELPKSQTASKREQLEATGMGTLTDVHTHRLSHVVAPLDDGSVCIWDVSSRSTSSASHSRRIVAQSAPGMLSGRSVRGAASSHATMTDTGAVECVSVDSITKTGYFAVQNLLHQVDLNTLQIASTKQYPWPITALSESRNNVSLTVGTNWTIHLHDTRDAAFRTSESTGGGELIGGSLYSHATLAQPGPLSILHDQGNSRSGDSIWVAGRSTSLLNYDRRFFPRLSGSIHSGARIAALTALPYPLVPRRLDLVRNPDVPFLALVESKDRPGTTMVAAAEYKGKGSLELYGLLDVEPYQNRQTASASKLLSVAPHGGRLVFSDGDGNLKWVDRDGFSQIRTFNINDTTQQDANPSGIWSSTASEMPGQGDIVQKIVPTTLSWESTSHVSRAEREDINQSNLLLWTGDGRLGMLGFGPHDPLRADNNHEDGALVEKAETAEQIARHDAERQYGLAMRRALERNADEVRFVRGLGMGYSTQW